MSLLEQELGFTRPIDERELELVLSVFMTADLVRGELAEELSAHGLTLQQHNVLRILAGAGPKGMPVLEVGEKLIEASANITRLIDRLAAKGLCERHRCDADRRLVRARLTPAGRELLERLKAPLLARRRALCSGLTSGQVERLCESLERVRRNAYERSGAA